MAVSVTVGAANLVVYPGTDSKLMWRRAL